MADRLSALDVSYLYLEEDTTPMHVGALVLLEPPDPGWDRDRVVSLIRERVALVPRYRQKVRWVPGRIANPVWVDDSSFDIDYHVRQAALPRPGGPAELAELVGRVMARPLDRGRPLWEMYVVGGLQDGRVALVTKTHHAMVDGAAAIDIGQILLDTTPTPRTVEVPDWTPEPEPSDVDLVVDAVNDIVRSPALAWEAARTEATDLRSIAERVARGAYGVLGAVRTMAVPPSATVLNAEIGPGRVFGTATASLDDFRRIRRAHGGTVNDVVLAVVAGALRSWLMTRGEPVTASTTIKALVPLSLRSDEGVPGNQIAAFIAELPVGEPQPVVRLHRVSYEMEQLKSAGQAMAAEALVGLAGFAPPTLHALGARSVSGLSRRMFNIVVSNVPGPQATLYAAGARVLAAHPIVPLARGQVVALGVTSYDGGMYFGLNAARDAMPDVDVLVECLRGAVDELLDTVPPDVTVVPRAVDSKAARSLAPRRGKPAAAGPA